MTLRQLVWMHRGRVMCQWNQTASIIAMVHNVNVKANHQRPPDHFNPFGQKQEAIKVSPQQGIKLLSSILVPK